MKRISFLMNFTSSDTGEFTVRCRSIPSLECKTYYYKKLMKVVTRALKAEVDSCICSLRSVPVMDNVENMDLEETEFIITLSKKDSFFIHHHNKLVGVIAEQEKEKQDILKAHKDLYDALMVNHFGTAPSGTMGRPLNLAFQNFVDTYTK